MKTTELQRRPAVYRHQTDDTVIRTPWSCRGGRPCIWPNHVPGYDGFGGLWLDVLPKWGMYSTPVFRYGIPSRWLGNSFPHSRRRLRYGVVRTSPLTSLEVPFNVVAHPSQAPRLTSHPLSQCTPCLCVTRTRIQTFTCTCTWW